MIKKRKVFYLSGFDPRGGRFYKGIFNRELKKYSDLNNKEIISNTIKSHHTHVSSWKLNGNNTPEVHYDFLKWDDIVRQHWIRNPLELALKTLLTYFFYITNLQWEISRKLAKNPIYALFYPLVTLVLFWFLFYLGLDFLAKSVGYNLKLVTALLALIPAALVLDKIKSLWLLRFFIFNVRAFHLEQNLLDTRLQYFADIICADLESDKYDEIILISHSNGTILSVPLLYKIFNSGVNTKKLGVLSMGHCLPLATYYRSAKRIKSELKFLSEQDFIWHDIGSKPDGVCFAKQNPFLPLKLKNVKARAVLLSPAFYKYYEPENYKIIKRNKFELHFRYLYCTDKPSPYNLFSIITSNKTLDKALSHE